MKLFVDNRPSSIQEEFPRTHADAFAERVTEAGGEAAQRMQEDALQAGALVIKGAVQAGEVVPPDERNNPYENVIPLARLRK